MRRLVLVIAALSAQLACGVSLDANRQLDDEEGNDPDDPSDPDDDPEDPVDGTGLVGGLVELTRLQIACPACLGVSEMQVSASAGLHAPTSASWLDTLPPVGQCARNFAPTPPSVEWYDVGEWAYLNFASTSIAMRRGGGSGRTFLAENLAESQYVSNGSYDLSVPDAGALGDDVEVIGALRAAEGFDAIEPYEMLFVQPEAAFQAMLSPSGAAVQWSPAGSGTSFVVLIDAYDYDTGAPLNRSILCHGPDNGYMALPGSHLGALQPSPGYPALLTVTMLRRRVSEAVIAENGATLQSIAMAGVMGTATLY